jgi:CHAT domain-containing protein
MVSVYEKGRLAAGPASWKVTGQDFFDKLQTATTAEAFDKVADGISIEMADEITDLLDRKDLEGITTLIIGDERVAPFEAMRLRRSQNGPLLGADRPVVRWISKKGMALVPAGSKIACIRPNYSGTDELLSAKKEEQDLQRRYPQMTVARTSAQLDELLKCTDVAMLHFAGHSGGNPPSLILEDGPVDVMKFSSSSKLMTTHPVIFANGCRAGQSLPGVPAMQANFAKIVLKSGASGFIAPMIEIDSPAAFECEKVFYQALETDTVAEAVRKVRALAETTEEKQKATCASYAAFVSTELRLHLT